MAEDPYSVPEQLAGWRDSEPVDLSTAFDIDFAEIKRDVARKALGGPRRPKKVPPDLHALIEEFAVRAAESARNPRSSIKGIKSARTKLQRRLISMKLDAAKRTAALLVFEQRWPRILTGASGDALEDRIRRWV